MLKSSIPLTFFTLTISIFLTTPPAHAVIELKESNLSSQSQFKDISSAENIYSPQTNKDTGIKNVASSQLTPVNIKEEGNILVSTAVSDNNKEGEGVENVSDVNFIKNFVPSNLPVFVKTIINLENIPIANAVEITGDGRIKIVVSDQRSEDPDPPPYEDIVPTPTLLGNSEFSNHKPDDPEENEINWHESLYSFAQFSENMSEQESLQILYLTNFLSAIKNSSKPKVQKIIYADDAEDLRCAFSQSSGIKFLCQKDSCPLILPVLPHIPEKTDFPIHHFLAPPDHVPKKGRSFSRTSV